MSLRIQAALQSRIDRRTNFLRELEEERSQYKTYIQLYARDADDGHDVSYFIKYYRGQLASVKVFINEMALEQRLDKYLLRQQVMLRRDKRVKKHIRSTLAAEGYTNVVVV